MASKRASSTAFPSTDNPKRRAQLKQRNMASFAVTNVQDHEIVHQVCLLVTGQSPSYGNSATDYVSVENSDSFKSVKPAHVWPVANGEWKALVQLECGQNELKFDLHHAGGISSSIFLKVVFQPLLQTPPLHLTILVGKDSPLLIDCPPAKYGAISSAHSSLDAAVAKFRTTALMWQALTAEDMRAKGLGRRAFRLEEEWSPDTTSVSGSRGVNGGTLTMRSVPKVHIVCTDKTVAELRDPKCAQQNRHATNDQLLHEIFTQALKKHGAPFDSNCRPVVAGLILDSHYSLDQDLILGHAALGCHNANGISLGIFGSHLSYSWPRFFEEISACLTDSTPPGDSVGNDNDECDSMAHACFVGQGAFLHEVGHAFGADHTSGIMARGYSKDWIHNFQPHAAKIKHDAKWDLQDALRFMLKPHFRIPGDEPVTSALVNAEVRIEVSLDEDGEAGLKVHSSAGLAQVVIESAGSSDSSKTHDLRSALSGRWTGFSITDFAGFDRESPLQVSALAMNGKTKVVKDAWRLLASKSYIIIPGSKVKLRKTSIKAANMTEYEDDDYVNNWSVLLRKRGPSGSLARVSAIDLRVGCTFDGVVVHYSDNTTQNCGPPVPHRFGGHASEKQYIPKGARIVKVEIGERGGWGGLDGIRMTLDNGDVWGELNADSGSDDKIEVLEPGSDERIVGFYGKSSPFVQEFGIITAPKGFTIPDAVYDMQELQNGGVNGGNRGDDSDSGGSQDEDSQMTAA